MLKPRAGRASRIAGWIGLAAVAVAVAVLLGIIVPRPFFAPAGPPAGEPERRILVLANPIHTDIAFPADADVLERLGFIGDHGLPLGAPGLRWVLIGWGSRTFYLQTPTWGDLRPGPVLRAFTVDASAMHVELIGDVDPGHDDVLPLTISEEAMHAMLEEALATFQRSVDGEPVLIAGSGYGDFDLFYEAEGRFNAFYGCNEWTGRVLRAGGIRTGWWNPLPPSLLWSVRLANELGE